MKFLIALLAGLFSSSALASGGFTWLGGIAHSIHLPWQTVTFIFVCLFFLSPVFFTGQDGLC